MITEFEKNIIKQNPNFKKDICSAFFVPSEIIKSPDTFGDFRFDEFIKFTLNDDAAFEKLNFLLQANGKSININCIKDNKISSYVVIGKQTFFKKFNEMFEDEKLNIKEKEKLETLIHTCDWKEKVKTLTEGNFSYRLDKGNLTIEKKKLFNLLVCPESEFENFFDKSTREEKIYGFSKEEYLCLLTEFILEDIEDTVYFLPDEVAKRFERITSMEDMDFEHLGKNFRNEEDDEFLEDLKISPNLKEHIFKFMPENLTTTQKAAYIYLKMCRTLNYDEQFYLSEQRGQPARKHEDVSRMALVDKDNNDVVCYDFNAIYAKFLFDMGVELSINSYGYSDRFGGGHANLDFKIDKFILRADSSQSIISNDLFMTKINDATTGLVCKNISEKTCREFKDILQSMYILVREQELDEECGQKVVKDTPYTFEECISGYEPVFEDEKEENDFEDKINILMSNVKHQNLNEIDTLFYVIKLNRLLFNFKEQNKNMSFVILKENIDKENDVVNALAVLTLSKDYNDEETKKDYYMFDNEDKKWNRVEKKILQNRLNSGELEYITGGPNIPSLSKSFDYYEEGELVTTFE